MNPTIRAARDDGESAYGFGRFYGGQREDDSEYSLMTAALKKAVLQSKFEGTPSGAPRSGSSSVAGSHGSRKGSHTDLAGVAYEELSLSQLNISSLPAQGRRRSDESSEAESEVGPSFDPAGLKFIRRLGEGTGGSVDLVQDQRTGRIMAKKVSSTPDVLSIKADAKKQQIIAQTVDPSLHRQILRELKFLNECSCSYIVEHYGSFLNEREQEVGILMEYCEGGSLDGLISKMKKSGMRCSEHVLGRIAGSVSGMICQLHQRFPLVNDEQLASGAKPS